MSFNYRAIGDPAAGEACARGPPRIRTNSSAVGQEIRRQAVFDLHRLDRGAALLAEHAVDLADVEA